jgi:hypothetical protein
MIQVSLDNGRSGTEIVAIEQKSNNGINHFNLARARDLAKKIGFLLHERTSQGIAASNGVRSVICFRPMRGRLG